jgi:hypothetical protein
MNIDELRQTLSTLAEEVDSVDAPTRLQAIDAKVVRVRRQRIVAGVACAAVAAVVGLVVPGLVGSGGDGPEPANNPTTSPSRTTLPTVEDEGTRFYTSPAGDTLLGEAMGPTGARVVTLRVVPATTDLSYRSVCSQPGPSPDGKLVYDVTINGKPVKSASCDGPLQSPLGPDTSFGFNPRVNRDAWRTDVGIVPGKPITLRVSLKPVVTPSRAATTRLGIALYADTGPMVHDHDVWLHRETVVNGRTYELVRRAFGRVHGLDGHLRLDLPRATAPLYLEYGVGHARGDYRFYGDGSGSYVDKGGPSSEGQLARPGQQMSRMSIHLHTRPGAIIYILAYRQVG